jgi:hypothetical protein
MVTSVPEITMGSKESSAVVPNVWITCQFVLELIVLFARDSNLQLSRRK